MRRLQNHRFFNEIFTVSCLYGGIYCNQDVKKILYNIFFTSRMLRKDCGRIAACKKKNQMGTPQPTTSFNFQQSFQLMLNNSRNIFMQHNVATFDAVQANANWTETLFTIGSGAAVAAIITAVFHPFNFISDLFSTFFSYFIAAFIGVGILWAIAVFIFKGTGQFLPYLYTLALIEAPVIVVNAVLGIVPVLGALAAIVVSVFAGYMAILATQSVHKMSFVNALLTVVIPAAVLIILSIVSYIYVLLFLHSVYYRLP